MKEADEAAGGGGGEEGGGRGGGGGGGGTDGAGKCIGGYFWYRVALLWCSSGYTEQGAGRHKSTRTEASTTGPHVRGSCRKRGRRGSISSDTTGKGTSK